MHKILFILLFLSLKFVFIRFGGSTVVRVYMYIVCSMHKKDEREIYVSCEIIYLQTLKYLFII